MNSLATRETSPRQMRMTGQADSDAKLMQLWLHGKAKNTQEGYKLDLWRFNEFVDGKQFGGVTLGDLQDFSDSLEYLAPATINRTLSAVKSLLNFAHEIGYLQFNVGAALQLRSVKNTLAERIMSEPDVHKLIAMEPDKRNRVLLRLLYAAGLRVSEVCSLAWRDLQDRGDEGQVTVFGKGGKTRAILLSADTWREVGSIRGQVTPDEPVFQSRKGGHPLSRVQVMRIVRAAATRAGIQSVVSPHWLRHAHASHALDRGCPVHIVQTTLGHASLTTTSNYAHARPQDSSARYLAV